MGNSNFCSCMLFLVAISFLSPPCTCKGELLPLPKKLVPLFVFGDLIFDFGNNNYINTTIPKANFWPYGQTFFKYPSGRYSDGRVIPDFIAEYANLPLLLPYLHPSANKLYAYGINFASGGAGALDETFQGSVISLKTQLRYFKKVKRILRKKLGDEEAKELISRAVYLFCVGINDYGDFTEDSKFRSYSFREYVHMVIGNLTTVIQEIHEKGGRKFAVLNVPSLDLLPFMKEVISQGRGGWVEELKQLSELHNENLYKALTNLRGKLKGFIYSYVDINTAFNDIINNNPAKYGLKEVKGGCCGSGKFRGIHSCGGKRNIKEYELCGNPNEYLFFDSTHPTDRGNQILSEMMWNGNSNTATPINLKPLFQM